MLTILGRPLWYDPPKLISFGLDDDDTSQQIFDIYSISHIQGGILLYFFLYKVLNIRLKTALLYLIIIVFIFEIIENMEFVIKKFRKTYRRYKGDSIVNIIGDILCGLLGFLFAYNYPIISVIFFIIAHIILYPFEAGFFNIMLTLFH
jgi:hypothetical protein